MRQAKVGLTCMLGLLSSAAWASPPSLPTREKPFIVHEWGTLLTMNGSDGAVLDSMYHEEHALPDFVHTLSQDQLYPPEALVKFETPVIYFYTDQPRHVDVTARFMTGIWTHWFPQAEAVRSFMAKPNAPAGSRENIQRGSIHWQADFASGPNRSGQPPAAYGRRRVMELCAAGGCGVCANRPEIGGRGSLGGRRGEGERAVSVLSRIGERESASRRRCPQRRNPIPAHKRQYQPVSSVCDARRTWQGDISVHFHR